MYILTQTCKTNDASVPETDRTFFETLDKEMLANYTCVNPNQNLFIKNLQSLTKHQKIAAILQYTHLPKTIISIFVDSIYVLDFHGFYNLVTELRINIREELGEFANGANPKNIRAPHFSLLRSIILKDMNLDIHQSAAEKYTHQFLLKLKQCVNRDNPYYVSGVVYALESSAITELQIVKRLIQDILSPRTLSARFTFFFDSHIGPIETGHKHDLQENCLEYLTSDIHRRHFESGFKDVLEIMELWWDSMYHSLLTD
ncbi:MAG: DUF3865 domain-containing protein [Bacteroidota bacterium]